MAHLKNKTVFLTGADGFIGSHVLEQLVMRCGKVKALAQYNSLNSWGWIDQLPPHIKTAVEVHCGDIRDGAHMKSLMNGSEIVLHLAALIAIPYSYHAPASYVQTNILGTLNLLEAARECGVEKFVQTSTSEVYGTAEFVPITEIHPLKGQSPYAATKIGADELALSFFRSFQTPVTVLRPFNTFGPRQSARAVIPTIITQILEGRSEIQLGFVDSTRDFTFVEDTALGFLAAAESDQCLGQTVNLGTQFEISIRDLAHLIAEVMGKSINIVEDEKRKRPENSEVERLCASNLKARTLMDWNPEYVGREGLKEGLKRTVEWFSKVENQKLYKSNIYNL